MARDRAASKGLRVGCLVQGAGLPGIGRVQECAGESVKLQFFESVVTPVAAERWVRTADCQHVRLERQTRVYWLDQDTAAWRAGRVIGYDDAAATYFVRPPNSESDLRVAEDQLHVRWDKPVSEPLHVLIGGANESPYFRDTRLPMITDLIMQRAASMSMPALLSSAIDIFPHQVHTALTVLSDPVQRYLLADEVGLGKTVEAGLIIRQTLLDSTDSRVLVVTPDVLRRQWVEELIGKFFIDDFARTRLSVVSHENPQKWSKYHDYDLVVVDEAHRLVNGYGPQDTPYQELAALAHAVPRLLLLSATPFSSRPRTQLGLLHLLDSELYRWENLDAFDLRVTQRKELANAVFKLDAMFEQELPYAIDDIAQVIREDPHFIDLAEQVKELLTEDGDLIDEEQRTELTSRVAGLRGHISETYRLHRRLIRHRRHEVTRDDDDAGHLPFAVTGRQQAEVLVLDSDGDRCVADVLAFWQQHVQRVLVDNETEERASFYGDALSVLISRADPTGQDLSDALAWRLHGDEDAARRAGLTDVERAMLRTAEVLADERQALTMLNEVSEATELTKLAELIVSAVSPSSKTVVFCGAGSLADRLARHLARHTQRFRVALHTTVTDADHRHAAVTDWRATGGLLIVDHSAEEGLNLQDADAALHCRLPWSPNDLEQRLGRIDRFGPQAWQRKTKAASHVLVGTDHEDTFPGAWLSLLTAAYSIFDMSVSALQDTIAEQLRAIWSSALMFGPSGLRDQHDAVIETLRQGRAELDKIDMLESVHDPAKIARDVVDRIGALDMKWKKSQNATLQFASGKFGGLGFSFRTEDSSVSFGLQKHDLLVPPRLLSLKRAVLDKGQLAGTFDRARATAVPGTRLFRLGSPFIDALGTVLTVDDRGQASVFWRHDPNHDGEPLVVFGFDYLAEAAIDEALELAGGRPEAQRAVRRQADSLLSPMTLRIWVSAGTDNAVEDPRLVELLGRPYDKKRDRNLNQIRINALHNVIGGADRLDVIARRAHEVARTELARRADLTQRCNDAYAAGLEMAALLRAQANARAAASEMVGDGYSALQSVHITDRLVQGLRSPRIRTLAASCVLISPSLEVDDEH